MAKRFGDVKDEGWMTWIRGVGESLSVILVVMDRKVCAPIANHLAYIDDVAAILRVGFENVYDVASLDDQWLVAPVLIYLHTIFESRELCFWSKIDIGR